MNRPSSGLVSGSTLGPYEILRQVGAGGMGEVYRARDTRLGRDVAIKILPALHASDPARRKKFEREARLIGQLSHPNILRVYDVGHQENQAFIVTELLEGDTLHDRLARGPLSVGRAVEIASGVAHGLAFAHDHGIVHCDLKPHNIFLTRDGQVKILDFGLATLTRPKDSDSTRTLAMTREQIWGSLGYTSPEQLRGQTLDHRSDLFSFGAVLYEMLTGRSAFRRDSSADTASAILHEDAPGLMASRLVPPALERIVRHCLEKSPDARFRSAHDLAFQLESVAIAPVAPSRKAAREVTFRQITFRRGRVYSGRFATDGGTILYSAAWEGGSVETFLKRPEAPDAIPLHLPPAQVLAISARGEVASQLHPRFVHNGVWSGTLATSPLLGGAPREVAEDIQHADYSPKNDQLAVTRDRDGKGRLEFPIGHVLHESQGHLSFPRFSPGGDRIAFIEHPWPLDDRGAVAVVDLYGAKSTLSNEWATVQGLAWSPDGTEVWIAAAAVGTARSLYAIGLGGELRSMSGFPGAARLLDVSPDGRILLCRDGIRVGIYAKSPGEVRERELSWMDWSLLADITADGRMILFDEENEQAGPHYVACVRGTDGSPVVQLGEGAARLLSPDGRWALCRVPMPDSPLTLYPTGPGPKREIDAGGRELAPGRQVRWLPDGRRILQFGRSPGGAPVAWLLDLETTEWTLVPSEWQDLPLGLALSPDGSRLAVSYPNGATDIVSPLDGSKRAGPSLEAEERIVAFDRGGERVYVCASQGRVPCPTYLLDLSRGHRVPWKEIGPADLGGVTSINLRVSPDGEAYAYSYSRTLSELYVVEGLE